MSVAESGRNLPSAVELPKAIFDYEVIDFIGEGAGSLIYVVSNPGSRQLYALKHVVKRKDKDQRFIEQVENEFEVSRKFSHPVLRRSFDLKDNRTLLRKATEVGLVMELVDGTPLDLARPTSIADILGCFIQVAQGLQSLHTLGYIHCDLKPSNILLNSAGHVKVIDFGQACAAGQSKERIQGTPDFIAPEQVRCEAVTPQTDVFNFGATLYWTLAGRSIPTLYTVGRQENGFLVEDAIPSTRDLNPLVPEPVSNFVMECIRVNPAKRPADMAEIIRRLEVMHFAAARRSAEVA